MNRQQLVDAVGERLGDRKTAAVAVEAVLETVTGALADGERVALFGFGVFEKVDRAARTARNPSTGGTVEVPATAVPRFRPGQALKDAVNGRSARTGTAAEDAPARSTTATEAPTKAPAKAPAKAAPAEAPAKAPAEAAPSEPAQTSTSEPKASKAKADKAKADKAKADKPKARAKADGPKGKADKGKAAKPKAKGKADDGKKKGKGK